MRDAQNAREKRLTRRRVKGCNSALFGSRTDPHETDLPAIGHAPQADPRLPRAHAEPRGAGSIARETCQGALTVERLSAGTATLPRSARLLRREQYRAALAAGAAGARRHFTLFAKPNGLSQARIGIITSRRVARRAVDRNWAKRLIREAFRKARHRLAGIDVVVELRRCPTRAAAAAAGAEIAKLLDELGTQQRAN